MAIFKKSLAVLLSALMLLTVIPLGSIAAAAETEVMGQLLLEQPVTVNITAPEQKVAYYFTPEEDGFYTFSSACDNDTVACLYNSSWEVVSSDDDGGEESNFLIKENLIAGQTYYLEVCFYSDNLGSFDISVVSTQARTITDVVFNDVSYCGEGEVRYHWNEETQTEETWYEYNVSPSYTVYYSDGSFENSQDFTLYDDYGSYDITVINEQDYENRWEVGNSYIVNVTVDELDIESVFTVSIKPSPVVSVSVDKQFYIKNYYGEYRQDYGYNHETGEPIGQTPEYFYYYISGPSRNSMQITLSNGTVVNDNCFEFEGATYEVTRMYAQQSYENKWEVGNTYTVSASIAGYSFTYEVEIVETPITSVDTKKFYLIENISGGFVSAPLFDPETNDYIGNSPEYFYYNEPYLSDGDLTINFNDSSSTDKTVFDWHGFDYGISYTFPVQNYENQWTVGNTYEINASVAGFDFTYEVEIIPCLVSNVQVEKYSFLPDKNGHYTTDSIFDDETGEYLGETPEYFYYEIPYPNEQNTVITLFNGETINGTSFYWNGEYYYIGTSVVQNYYNQWLPGNTYDIEASIAGYDFTYEVEILPSPVESVYIEKFTFMEGRFGHYTTDPIFDDETGEYLGETPEYFVYDDFYPSEETTTIHLSNGETLNGAVSFYWEGEYYGIEQLSYLQNYENQWTAGNTYTVTGRIAGHIFTYEVEILPSPIASVTLKDYTYLAGTNGHYRTDPIYDDETGEYLGETPEYFYYYVPWPSEESTVIYLTNGEIIYGNNFDYNGEHFEIDWIDYHQDYENQWTGDNTYEIEVRMANRTYTFNVSIVSTPIESVEVSNVVLKENMDGCYSKDGYWDYELQEYIYTSPEYFCYNLPRPETIKIKFKGGSETVITVYDSPYVEFEGETYWIDFSYPEQNYENQWTGGGIYPVTCSVLGYEFTYNYEVVGQSSNDEFEFFASSNGVIITDSFISPEVLEIPEEIDGKPVIAVAGLSGSDEVKHLVFPDSVKTVGDYILSGFSNLKTVTFGSKVSNLYPYIFRSNNLEEIIVSSDNEYYQTVDGVLYNKDLTAVIAYPCGKDLVFNVPDSVTNIEAIIEFYQNVEIIFSNTHPLYVTENGVTYTKDKTTIVFCSRNYEGAYEMPDSVTDINSGAFAGCRKLTSVTVSKNVTEIVYQAFISCASLSSVTLPEGLVSIGLGAFSGAESLETITLPNTLKSIEESAFKGSGLVSVNIPGSVGYIGPLAFYETNISTLVLNEGLYEIGDRAFANLPITSLTIPNTVKYIGSSAFELCSSLKNLDLGSGSSYVGRYAFAHIGVKNLTIPKNISFGSGAFLGSAVENLTITNGVEVIGEAMFYDCDSLTAVIIPDSVTDIYCGAFADCAKLTTVKLGNSVTFLDGGVFANSPIVNLDLGTSITEIPGEAFVGANITGLYLPGSVTRIVYGAFMDCDDLTYVKIPLSVKEIMFDAFSGCESLTDVYYEGTKADRDKMDIDKEGNSALLNATWHYQWIDLGWNPNAVCPHAFDNNADIVCNRCGITAYPGGNTLIKEGNTWYHINNRQKVNDTTLVKFSNEWYYVKDGKVNNSNTIVKYNNEWYHVNGGKWVKDTTLVKYNNEWYYIKNGKIDFNATTLFQYSGDWYYIKDGKVNSSNTLVKYNNSWYHVNGGKWVKDTAFVNYSGASYYVKNGVMDTSTTLVKHNNEWYYIKDGKLNTSNTIVKYNGVWYHVNGGKWVKDTTLVNYGGTLYYIKNGVTDSSTTLVKHNNVWYYVKNGKVDTSANTLFQYSGTWYYVSGGKMNTSNTLVKYNGVWYHVNGGKWVKDTTLVNYGGTWYYVNGGKMNTSNTLVKYNGVWYHVNGGKWVKDTTLVNYGGTWYYVNGGKMNTANTLVSYNGTWYHVNGGKLAKDTTLVKYNGAWYYVKNGKVDFTFTGNFKYNGKTYKVTKGRI